MHAEVKDFFEGVRVAHPELFTAGRVLEIGSYDINGSIRGMFEAGEYVGLDWREGPGVDVVSLAHEHETLQGYDVIVSAVMLEHDPYWEQTIRHAAENLLVAGGSMILVWASGHPPHEHECSPESGYYWNLPLSAAMTCVLGGSSFGRVVGETVGMDSSLLLIGKESPDAQ